MKTADQMFATAISMALPGGGAAQLFSKLFGNKFGVVGDPVGDRTMPRHGTPEFKRRRRFDSMASLLDRSVRAGTFNRHRNQELSRNRAGFGRGRI